MSELWLRFLSGPDIDSLGLTNAEIVAAVEDAVRAHGDGRVVLEPRVHLVPPNDGAGHFNVLRGHLGLPAAGHPDLIQVEDRVQHGDVRERRAAGAGMAEDPRVGTGEVARPDRGHGPGPRLSDEGGVHDRQWHAGGRVVQRG